VRESLTEGDPLRGFVGGHAFEEVTKLGRARESLVYFPEDPFVFVRESLVVGVLEVGPAEGT